MKIYHAAVGMLATNCYLAVNEELKEGAASTRALTATPSWTWRSRRA